MIDRQMEPKIMQHLFRKASMKKIPLSGAFELTPACNMNCEMCYVRMENEEICRQGGLRGKEEWLKIAEQAKQMGTLYLLLTGGEPFLRKDFKEIYLALHKMGFVIAINSNGTMIDEKTVEWLKKVPPMRINITLYGSSNETYDQLCHNPQGFDQVKKAIKLLKEAEINVKLNASMTPLNIKDLDEMYEFAKKHELQIQVATYMFPPLRRNDESIGKNKRFLPEEAAKYAVYQDLYNFGEKTFKLRAEQMLKPITEICGKEEHCMKCRAGKSTFWMNWKGEMTTCGIMNQPKAYPFKVGFQKAWDEIVRESARIRLPKECLSCSKRHICKVCAAAVMTETGTYSQKPEYLCRMNDAIFVETQLLAKSLTNVEDNHEKKI